MQKLYRVTNNIGTCKYVVSYHDGVQTHSDGSQFFNINIFKNKKKLNVFIKNLTLQGYEQIKI